MLVLLFLGTVGLRGQVAFSGTVRNAAGEPVPSASVVLSACADERVLAFTYTDVEGRYRVVPAVLPEGCDTLVLTVRGLGYKSRVLHLAPPDRLRDRYDISLDEAQLQEVVIKGRYAPVVARGDTTDYNLASFSDSTEFTIEDLLKKLPGFSISENGIISVNGKLVERVLLDGDDLFSQNYALATRNIRADMFSTVQTIERYQDNPLMKGVKDSDRLVLNLKVREDRKRPLSGSVTGGGGPGDGGKYYGHTNLFSLSRGDKMYVIANANNAGLQVSGGVQAMTQSGPFDRSQSDLQQSTLAAANLLQEPSAATFGLPAPFGQRIRSALGYYGHVVPIGKTFKLKVSGWANQARTEQQTASNSRLLLGQDVLELAETRATAVRTEVFHVQADGAYISTDARRSLRFFTQIDAAPRRGDLNILRQEIGGTPFAIRGQTQKSPVDVFAALEYTVKRTEHSLFQVVAKQDYRDHDYVLDGEHAYYPLFFGLDTTFRRLAQRSGLVQDKAQIVGRYLAKRGNTQWEFETGADWSRARLRSEVELTNTDGEHWQPAPAAGLAGDFRQWAHRYFARAGVSRTWDKLTVAAQAHGLCQPVRFSPEGGRALLWSAQPSAELRYSINQHQSVLAHYGFRQHLPSVLLLYPGYRFTDNLHLVQGLTDPRLVSKHNAILRYGFNNRLRQFSWFVSATYSHTDDDFGLQYAINPFLSVSDRFRPAASTGATAMAGMSRYFPVLSSRFEVSLMRNASEDRLKVNSDAVRLLRATTSQAGVSYGSAFDTWVNVLLRVQAGRTVSDNRLDAGQTARITADNWFSTAEITVAPRSGINFKVRGYQAAFRSAAAPYTVLYAADAEARLNLPRWHSDVGLSVNNLLNTRRFETATADAFVQSTSGLTAVSRFLLVRWSVRF